MRQLTTHSDGQVSRIVFDTMKSMKAKLTEKRLESKKLAKDDWDFPCFMDRQKRLIALDKNGQRIGETWEDWDGTLSSILRYIAFSEPKGAMSIIVDGGFDGASSPQAYRDGDYQPWAGEYQVEIWVKANPCKVCGLPGDAFDGCCTRLHQSEFERFGGMLTPEGAAKLEQILDPNSPVGKPTRPAKAAEKRMH